MGFQNLIKLHENAGPIWVPLAQDFPRTSAGAGLHRMQEIVTLSILHPLGRQRGRVRIEPVEQTGIPAHHLSRKEL